MSAVERKTACDRPQRILQKINFEFVVFALAYSLSKVLIEKEASKIAEENGISLVTVCPVITVGPAPAAEAAKPSVALVLSLLSGEQ
uniref:Uncharacterized protein n=1 Tax=Oryza brachyantha TaxID=4533 RepID=J3M1P3_ORYBR